MNMPALSEISYLTLTDTITSYCGTLAPIAKRVSMQPCEARTVHPGSWRYPPGNAQRKNGGVVQVTGATYYCWNKRNYRGIHRRHLGTYTKLGETDRGCRCVWTVTESHPLST
jgi:hypothetical protein